MVIFQLDVLLKFLEYFETLLTKFSKIIFTRKEIPNF
jgi:hypothetical protein